MDILRIEEVGAEAAAAAAARVILGGGIVIYPTDTLYGIGVDARSEVAVAKLRRLKERDGVKPISVMVADSAAMESYASMNEEAKRLAAHFLPGPLTLVLPVKGSALAHIAQEETLGIRIPDSSFCRSFAKAATVPITATSANLAGGATPGTVEELLQHFPDTALIDLVIDAGAPLSGAPSTVVSCVEEVPRLIRVGALRAETLGL